MDKKISRTNSDKESIPFSIVDDEHTVGVGIDVDEHKFYVFYNNSFAYYDLIKSEILTDLTPCMWGAVTSSANDYVSVNFGDAQFKYNIISQVSHHDRKCRIE